MPRYNVLITRDCTESVELLIEADTPEAAIAAAEQEARESLDLNWVADDCSNHGDPYFAGEPSELEIFGEDAGA
jgi:hypothetical protein